MHDSGNSPVTYLIGRSVEADIVLEDMSVSRRHAELVADRDGSWYLTDRASSGGTFRLDSQGWVSIRQEYVHQGERLRFGGFECTLDDLLDRLPSASGAAAVEVVVSSPEMAPDLADGELGPGTPVRDDRPAGDVYLDQDTGQVHSMEDK